MRLAVKLWNHFQQIWPSRGTDSNWAYFCQLYIIRIIISFVRDTVHYISEDASSWLFLLRICPFMVCLKVRATITLMCGLTIHCMRTSLCRQLQWQDESVFAYRTTERMQVYLWSCLTSGRDRQWALHQSMSTCAACLRTSSARIVICSYQIRIIRVRIVTDLQAGPPVNRSWITGGGRDIFHFAVVSRPALGPTQATVK
jgi:hypothetical protein